MSFLCPACRTPIPAGAASVVTCSACSAEVDLSRAGTAAGRPRFVPEADRTGSVVGGFTLDRRVGAGGMGTVYRARAADGSPAAVKFLSPALAGEPDVVARFHREVKLLRSLDHPAIVRVLDSGEEDGVPWFAMEFVDGRDLRARLAEGRPGAEEVERLFGRLLEALQAVHAHGVVHRDLKPANVLLSNDGAKLADFGIARPDPSAGSNATRLTETAAIVGTFPYMSPEQRAGEPTDSRSDLFSVGVMLYEALTGRLPHGAFAPPSAVDRRWAKALDAVVSRLLQPDPAARYPSAADAARALRTALRPSASPRTVLLGGAAAAALLAVVFVGSRGLLPDGSTGRAPSRAAAPPPGAAADTERSPNEFDAQTVAAAQNVAAASIARPDEPNAPPDQTREANVVAQLESKAKVGADETPMRTSCDPTPVHREPSDESPVVASLPPGTAVLRLKTYRRFAEWLRFGLGTAAGAPETRPAQKVLAPSRSKGLGSSVGAKSTPSRAWYLVRFDKKGSGWIDERCASPASASKVAL